MKVQSTRADDKDIHFEGVASLSEEELVDACYERGLARKVEDTVALQFSKFNSVVAR